MATTSDADNSRGKSLKRRNISDAGLRQMWEEKFKFSQNVLGLDEDASARAADRTLHAAVVAEREFGR